MKKVIIFLILMLPFIFSSLGWGAYGAAIYKAKCAACHGADGQGTAIAPAFKGNAFIGKRSFEEISDVISNGRGRSAKRYKQFALEMPKQSLADDDLKAVIDYLRSLSGIAYSAPKPEFTEKIKSSNKDLILIPLTYFEKIKQGQNDSFSSDQSNSGVDFKGATIYKAKCAACHGKEGQGTAMAPAFKSNAYIRNSSFDEISNVILRGRDGPGKKYKQFAIGMPRQTLTGGDLENIIAHIRALAGVRTEASESLPPQNDITALFGADNDNVLKSLEGELSSKINELYAPRGEFETTREFDERQKFSKNMEARLRSEYESRINDERNRIDRKRKETVYPYTFNVVIGKYDADKEGFFVTFLDDEIFVNIPRDKAIVLSKHKEKTTVKGMLRYYNSEYAELVNAFLVDTETNDQFVFSKQTETALAMSDQKSAPVLNISSITLAEPSGNGILDAGESGWIKLTLKNSGKGAGFGVSVEFDKSALPNHLKLNEKIYVGTVNPDEEKTVEADITALEEIGSTDIRLKTTLTESSGFDSKPMVLSFKTKQLIPPLLQIAEIKIIDTDGNRVVSKGKEANITLAVQNAGAGIAKGIVAQIESGDSNIKLFGENRLEIGDLSPGESKRVTFNIAVTQRYNGPKILPLSFKIREGREKFSIKPDIQIALNEDAPDIKVVKVEAKETPEFKLQALEDINAIPSIEHADRVIGANDLAVVIGIERYRNLPKSEYSYNDAKLVKGYLRALGFADRNIEYLTDDGATLSGIRKSIESWLPNRMKKNNRVFLYYSGHGSPDPATGEAFLMPHDGDPNYLHETGYPLKRIYAALSKLEASEIIVVVDACFSGAGGRSVLAKGARPAMVSIENPVLASQKIAVLSSTQGAQISTSFPEKEHGLFTYYFLKAIKEGKKDMADIYSYLKPLVEDEAKALNVRQTPAMNPDPATLGGKFMLRK